MATTVRENLKDYKSVEVKKKLESLLSELNDCGLSVEFGNIGRKTTYALIYDDKGTEFTGYTYIRDIRRFDEATGMLRALEQALARKKTIEEKRLVEATA